MVLRFHQAAPVNDLPNLIIPDTTRFTEWHKILTTSLEVLEQRKDFKDHDFFSAPNSFWQWLANLSQAMLEITKALVVFLQHAHTRGAFEGNGIWAGEMVGRLRVQCSGYRLAVWQIAGIMEGRLEERKRRRRVAQDLARQGLAG